MVALSFGGINMPRDTKVIDGDLVVIGKIDEKYGEPDGDGAKHLKLGHLPLVQENNTLTSTKIFNNKHIKVLVEYETDGIHLGASVDLHPYNESICLGYYIIGDHTLTGFIDEEGHVVLAIPNDVIPTNIDAHYLIYEY